MVNNVEEYFREDPEASYFNKDGKKYFSFILQGFLVPVCFFVFCFDFV